MADNYILELQMIIAMVLLSALAFAWVEWLLFAGSMSLLIGTILDVEWRQNPEQYDLSLTTQLLTIMLSQTIAMVIFLGLSLGIF